MTEPTYTIKEIMELQFKGIDSKLEDIKNVLKDQNVNSEKRFNQIEKDIDDLKVDNTRYKLVLAIGATVGASLISFVLSRIF